MADKSEQHFHQRLSFLEKAGYSGGDAAANFVFMTMVCFQASFYTDVFGISAGTAGTIILVARLWDAFFDVKMKYTVEPGDFEIMVGSSSRDTDLQKQILTVTK